MVQPPAHFGKLTPSPCSLSASGEYPYGKVGLDHSFRARDYSDGYLKALHRQANQFLRDGLKEPEAFKAYDAPAQDRVGGLAKRPFAGPSQFSHILPVTLIASLSLTVGCRAVCRQRQLSLKDYRQDGNSKAAVLAAGEFIRRLLHTPAGWLTAFGTMVCLPTATVPTC